MADILGSIANPQMADIAGALDYRAKKLQDDEDRRKQIRTNQLAGEALSSGLQPGSPLALLAQENAPAYLTYAKAVGIDPADGSGMHQMTVDANIINKLANSGDIKGAVNYMQTEYDRRQKLGLKSDYLGKGLQAIQEDPHKFFNAVALLDQTWNPTPKKDLVSLAQGSKLIDPTTGKTIAENPKSDELTPFEKAQVKHWDQMAASQSGGLSDDAIELFADRLLKGEQPSKVLANLGRGAQGAADIRAVQNRLAEKAKAAGVDATKILQNTQNVTAENRTFLELGAREGKIATAVQEAQNFAKVALDASAKVPRDSFVPWNKLKNYTESQLSDPNLAAFKAANTSLINAYARAVGGGSVTVHGQEEGERMLSTATSPESYEAVVNQILTETQAALDSPKQVREHIHAGNNPAPSTGETAAQRYARLKGGH